METNWRLKLQEYVSAPLKKLTEVAGGAQKKLANMIPSNQIAKSAGSASNAIKRVTGSQADLAKQTVRSTNTVKGSLEGMRKQLDTLEKLQAKAWNPQHIRNYEMAIQKVKANMAKWHDAKAGPVAPVAKQGWMSRMKGGLMEGLAQSPLGGMAGMFNPKAMLAGLAVGALLTFGKASVDSSMQFEHGMSKINATAQLPVATLDKLKGRLLDIGGNSGGNFDNITSAYEKILSTTGKVNLSLNITETAVKGAKAGFAEIDLVAGALAQTMASVGNQNTTANEVMDTLLKAKAVGAGEFRDFAQYLPGLIAAGRNLGITFKDTAGLFAFMTYKGQSATDSAMLLQNAFSALQKKDILVGLEKKGIKLFDIHGTRKNIAQIMLELEKKMHGMSDKQKTKFFLDIGLNDAQARSAFSVLTSDAAEFKRIMGEVNNAVGETDRQLAMTGDRARTWGDIGDQWKQIGVTFGDLMMPIVDTLGAATQGLLTGMKDMLGLSSYWHDNFVVPFQQMNGLAGDDRDTMAKNTARRMVEREYEANFGQSHKKGDINPLNKQPYGSDYAGDPFKSEMFGKHKGWTQQRLGEWEKILGVKSTDKNKIDPNEKEGAKNAISKLNGIDNTNFEDGKKKKDKEGNSGLRTLIMNLEINNDVKTDEDHAKFRRKFTDDIVDAARDGMVTIGME